ncbi:5579_t:CDS:2, partial [Acaulospora colombiana]
MPTISTRAAARPLSENIGPYSIDRSTPLPPQFEHVLWHLKDIHRIIESKQLKSRRESTYLTYGQAVESVLHKARVRNRESSVPVMAIFIASISVALLACGQIYQEKLSDSTNETFICRVLLVNASFVLSATLSLLALAGETEHYTAVDREHPLTKEELEAVYIFESHLLSCQRKCE